ncbi:MAG: inorganic diphosphatase [Alphaproteobacteria bacterium]|nr:inorganic diphosphatase [Rickettsiales bacterium]
MDLSKIKSGNNVPEDINVCIEISAHSQPIKYEIDKDSGALFVDRIQHNSMFYPCNYGFVPNTMADDGDSLDALVISKYNLMAGSVINSRPIGVLNMEDEGGIDAKIICVPSTKVCPLYSNITEIAELDEVLIKEIKFFFSRYKDVQNGKWVKVYDFGDAAEAKKAIKESIQQV